MRELDERLRSREVCFRKHSQRAFREGMRKHVQGLSEVKEDTIDWASKDFIVSYCMLT